MVINVIKIYKIIDLENRKLYVGQTRHQIERRFLQHSKADSPLGEAMRQLGLDKFIIEVIEECETPEQANERERALIKSFNCKVPNGYNLTDGGEVNTTLITGEKIFTMRMQQGNYDKIRVIAAINKRSIAMQIEYLLEQCIADYEAKHGAIPLSPDNGGHIKQVSRNTPTLFTAISALRANLSRSKTS